MNKEKLAEAKKAQREMQKRLKELLAKEMENKKKGLPFDKELSAEIHKAFEENHAALNNILNVVVNLEKTNSK